AGRLAGELAQVVELGAADIAAAQNLNLLDARRMQGENPLDADSVRYFAHRKSRAVAAAIDLDHDPFELLEPLLLAFNDLDLNSQRIAGAKRGQILAQSTILEFLDDAIHGKQSSAQSQPK